MGADLRPQHVVRDVLVIAAGNQDHLFREAAQTRNGAAGAGGDGIVVEPHAVLHPHQLNAVLYAAEGFGDMADGLVGHQPLHHGDGGHIILYIVDAGNENVLGGKNFSPVPADNAVFDADVGHALAGEEPGGAVAPEGGGDVVVGVQHQKAASVLIAENVLFRVHIFLHILVDVQMVGREVGDHRPLGAALHVHELEGAKLHHGEIRLLHLPRKGKQGRANVAPQPDGFSLRFQHFGDQRGGGRFAVGAGDANDRAGADLEERFHFGGHLRAPAAERFDGGVIGVHPRRAKQDIRLHVVQIAVAYMEPAAHGFQLQNLGVQLFPGRPVAAHHVAAVFQQKPNQRPVADAKPQHRDFLIF